MKFRDDIDPANTWVVSDTHFGHENIVGFCHRPEDHDQVMIAEWRKAVPDDATVLHLGDLTYKSNAWFKNIIAPELTGARKLLVRGNHDKQSMKFYRDSGFKLVRPFAITYGSNELDFSQHDTLDDHPDRKWFDGRWWTRMPTIVSFNHYPWNTVDEGRPLRSNDLRVHGHIHNNGYTRDAYVPFLKQHVNMSIEQTGYKPVNLKLLLDGVLAGEYPETTDEQREEAARRKAAAQKGAQS